MALQLSLATGYADVNLEFYRTFQQLGERRFEFNIQTIPVTGQLTKQLGKSNWYAGLNYLFLKTELGLTNYDFHDDKAINTIISRPSVLIEYDGRDNIFTPDRGLHWTNLIGTSAE